MALEERVRVVSHLTILTGSQMRTDPIQCTTSHNESREWTGCRSQAVFEGIEQAAFRLVDLRSKIIFGGW